MPNPCCGVCKINEGVELLAAIELVIALAFPVIYGITISNQASCEKVDGCLIDSVVLGSIILGSILNVILQGMLSIVMKKVRLGQGDPVENVRFCRLWLGLRVITLGIIYCSMYFSVHRSGNDGVRGQTLIMLLPTPIILHIWTWYAVLAYTLHSRVRRQIEPPAPPPAPIIVTNGRASRFNWLDAPLIIPTKSSGLDKISSAADYNDNIV